MRHISINPLVSVIVPCLNEKNFIQNFLDNINLQILDFKIEVIVSDGGSDDGTIEILESFKSNRFLYRYILHNDKFVSHSLNRAIAISYGSIVIRMDVHTQYHAYYISNCVNVLQSHPVQCVGGPWRACYKNFFQESIALAFQSKLSSGGALSRDLKYKGYVDTVYLGCWYKSDLIKFGLFDVNLVRNQDDELCHRIRSLGGHIFQDPSIISYYYPRSNLVKLFQQYFQYGYWRFNTILKTSNRNSIRHYLPIFLVFFTFFNFFLIFTSYYKISFLYFFIYTVFFGFSILSKKNFFKIRLLLTSLFAIFLMHHSYGIGFLFSFITKYFNINLRFVSSITR